MNTAQLGYFLEIARQRNMNKAAEEVHVSQSSLSQYLSNRENELDCKLFYRKKGNLTLTPEGQVYHAYAARMRDLEQKMKAEIGRMRGFTHIRVGINSIWGNTLMATITPVFHDRYPDSKLELYDENHQKLKKYIQEESIDLAFLATDTLNGFSGYQKILRQEEVVFAVSRKNMALSQIPAGTTTLSIPELVAYFSKEPFILSKTNSSSRRMVDKALEKAGFHPNIVCEISNMTTLGNMISHNIAVSFMPRSTATDNLAICYFSLTPPITRLNAVICRENLENTEEVQYLIKLAEAHLPVLKPATGNA